MNKNAIKKFAIDARNKLIASVTDKAGMPLYLMNIYQCKKVLLPMTSAADLGTVPSDLVGAFSLIFYSSPEEAVYKALGVE